MKSRVTHPLVPGKLMAKQDSVSDLGPDRGAPSPSAGPAVPARWAVGLRPSSRLSLKLGQLAERRAVHQLPQAGGRRWCPECLPGLLWIPAAQQPPQRED